MDMIFVVDALAIQHPTFREGSFDLIAETSAIAQ